MEAVRNYLKVQLPRYLKGLPLPRTFKGFLKLKQEEWLYLAPLLITIGVLLFTLLAPSGKSSKPGRPLVRLLCPVIVFPSTQLS
ncbi:hypothetical protein ATCC90586_007414 [Pythium insidiosum]|nr:hypothetical protein ATCC90586_007414 [Pythium insidiosum]